MSKNNDVVCYEFHGCKIPSENYVRELVQDYIWTQEARGEKISVRQLGLKTGISDRTLSRWLKGEHNMLYSTLEKLMNYLATTEEGS